MTEKDKAAEKPAPASSGPPIISSVTRDKVSEPPRSRSSSSDVSAIAKAEKTEKAEKADAKKRADAKVQTGEIELEAHTAEVEAVNDDVVVIVDDDVPMPSLPPDEDEDNEATAVFSLRDEIRGTGHKK